MPTPIEARLRDVIFVFEDPILHLYDRSRLGGAHYHADLLRSVTVDNEFVRIVSGDSSTLLFVVDAAQRPAAEQIAAAVTAAIQAR